MNATSSRSHAIFTVTMDCSDKGPDGRQRIRVGKLHLVDLAVSITFKLKGKVGKAPMARLVCHTVGGRVARC